MYTPKRDLFQPCFFNLIKKYVLWSMIAFGSASCKFDLEEINPPESAPPEADKFDITLIANDSSQLVIYKPTNFTFGITNDSRFDFGPQAITISLNEEQIRDINFASFGESLTFTIDPRNFNDGTYTLSIASEFSFIGNSLAASTNTSNSLFQEWELVIDKTPDPIEITSVEVENGELVVYWDPETIRNFDELYLVGESTNISGSKFVQVDRLANKATFPYFLEGELALELRTSTDYDITSTGPTYTYTLEENIVDFQLQDSTISVHIKRPSLYKNVESFNVNGTSYDSFDSDVLSIELETDLLFGPVKDYAVSFLIGPNQNYFSYDVKLGLGIEVPAFNKIKYDEINELFFLLDYESSSPPRLYKLNKDLNSIDTLEFDASDDGDAGNIALSPDRTMLSFLTSNSTCYLIDPMIFQVEISFSLSSIYSYLTATRIDTKITNDSLVFVKGWVYEVIDIMNNTELFSDGGIAKGRGDISNDFRYIFNYGKLYEKIGNEYIYQYDIDVNNFHGMFIDDTRLLHFKQTQIDIIDVNSGMVLNSFMISGLENLRENSVIDFMVSLDFQSQSIVSYLNENSVSIYDFTGNLKFNRAIGDGGFYYHGDYLFTNNGRAIKIQL